ncbi:MAG: hypothetical protein JW810_04140 [Sedimentisphaerales bacterium]|nr:hypothetical protein [Sedimentisphaerales bacterium]
MSKPSDDSVTVFVVYNHIESDGKCVNLQEMLEEMDADRVCISLGNGRLDPPCPDKRILEDRWQRLEWVQKKLRRGGVRLEVALPSLTAADPDKTGTIERLEDLCRRACRLDPHRIWIDDTAGRPHDRFDRSGYLAWFRRIGRILAKGKWRRSADLLAGSPERYEPFGLSAGRIAMVLADGQKCRFAQMQPFDRDRDRTAILQAAFSLGRSAAYGKPFGLAEAWGFIEHPQASGFQKSAESTQMQFLLNRLFGRQNLLLNAFDLLGNPPNAENPYLNIWKNSQRVNRQFSRLLGGQLEHAGLGLIIPEGGGPPAGAAGTTKGLADTNASGHDAAGWSHLLWRLGLPVVLMTPQQALQRDTTFVLTGRQAGRLNQKQLEHLFHHGVLLDATAAATLAKTPYQNWLGCTIHSRCTGAQIEILSDGGFGAPYYGRRTLLCPDGDLALGTARQPRHTDARPITTLQGFATRANIPGIVIFDDTRNRRRCAILPYDLGTDSQAGQGYLNGHSTIESGAHNDPPSSSEPGQIGIQPLLSPVRQRHLQDLLAWLRRGRLDCQVENAPDLVPFLVRIHPARRLVMALLNISFDWAIEARIRFGSMPFAVRRVRELNEQGQWNDHAKLRWVRHQDYQYIQLTPETAVPPMQMTILALDG